MSQEIQHPTDESSPDQQPQQRDSDQSPQQGDPDQQPPTDTQSDTNPSTSENTSENENEDTNTNPNPNTSAPATAPSPSRSSPYAADVAVDTDTQADTDTDGEATAATDARATTDTDGEAPAETCPECGGRVVTDDGEQVCATCGLVVDDTAIDHGPEWRAFDERERNEKSRVGQPTTPLFHDNGLSTKIDWRNTDAKGNTLSARRRRTLNRLRTRDKRSKATSKKDNLRNGLGEIKRVCSALGLGTDTRECAAVIFRRAHEAELLPGRAIEAVASGAVLAAARQLQQPRTHDEVTRVSRVEHTRVLAAYRYLQQELGLAVPPASPLDYVDRVVNDLLEQRRDRIGGSDADIDGDRLKQHARETLTAAIEANYHSGKAPKTLAAAAVYLAVRVTDQPVTQADVSAVSNTSCVAIRTHYRRIAEIADIDVPDHR